MAFPVEERTSEREKDSTVAEQEDENENEHEQPEEIIKALSTQALEQKLASLQSESNRLSQALTQKLATSQSGQNLLHIGSSLSTLPPDLHALLTHLHPVLSEAESTEKQHLANLQKLVIHGDAIRLEQRRVYHARQCADLYQDLQAAEHAVAQRKKNILKTLNADEDTLQDDLDHAASLERAAHTTLLLVQDLHHSSQQISSLTSPKVAHDLPSLKTKLDHDTERAQFLMKLAPRIRKLETEVISALSIKLETCLQQIQRQQQEEHPVLHQFEELFLLGHCFRGLAILGKGGEAENVFARVAIMPLIRSKISMGRLDQGGARGECAGLRSLLHDIVDTIATTFGPVLQLAESMFEGKEVDLVTAGVWVPIATALLADAGVKMAIFSPGIANVLQANYLALDTFLSRLSTKLLQSYDGENQPPLTAAPGDALAKLYSSPTVSAEAALIAQRRVYSHPMTTEFSKRWNLPIYYQLRFGDCCARLNNAIAKTQREGWIVNVCESEDALEALREEYGMELPLFVEVYDILSSFWKPNVFLRPLTHRFLRGAYQIIGRISTFVREGMEGTIEFGEERKPPPPIDESGETNGEPSISSILDAIVDKAVITRDPYKWGEIVEDVAAVAWELTVLESKLKNEYAKAATEVAQDEEIGQLIVEVLKDAAQVITPLVHQAWNEVIVKLLIAKCSGPLAAVKGVAATYRMTNRPPPKQASPFVSTILRPLLQFIDEFRRRIPLGVHWKIAVVNTVADRYASAVEELIVTVQRTEVALQSRRARRTVSGGMSDGEKVKLQLLLDYKEFSKSVQMVGVDPQTVEGVRKLMKLTEEVEQAQNGNSS